MDAVTGIRSACREIYGRYSLLIRKAVQFLLAYLTFSMINNNIAFMGAASSKTVTLGLSVVCTFFPMLLTVLAAAGLFCAHMFALSYGFLAATVILFLLMFIFYLRFTPRMSLFLLLTPLGISFHVPFAVATAAALLFGPVAIVPIACGTLISTMMQYVESAAPALAGENAPGLVEQISGYIKTTLTTKEMWLSILAMVIGFMVIYVVRRTSLDHAWTIAIVAGVLVHVIVTVAAAGSLGVSAEMGSLIPGVILSVLVGVILKLFYFHVDYKKTEFLQYEDDDYYYYVKAVPKKQGAKKRRKAADSDEDAEEGMEETRTKAPLQTKRNLETTEDVNQALLEESMRREKKQRREAEETGEPESRSRKADAEGRSRKADAEGSKRRSDGKSRERKKDAEGRERKADAKNRAEKTPAESREQKASAEGPARRVPPERRTRRENKE